VRLALGGVATTPWRAREAERLLLGGPASEEAYRRAAEAELASADVRPGNAFKTGLARATVAATLRDLGEGPGKGIARNPRDLTDEEGTA
jgi:xanthine dehydrogenase YagS FAD-binding subunit